MSNASPMNGAGWILSFGGLGRLPLFPGTWGTLGAVALAAALLAFVPHAQTHWRSVSLGVALVATGLTLLLTDSVEDATGGKDPQMIVMDEVAGYFVALAVTPHPDVATLVVAFFAFRLFDIVKLWPANLLERLPGGWGVTLDDLAAGAYAAAAIGVVEMLTA